MAAQHRQQQQAVGGREGAAALPGRITDHQRAAGHRAGPEAGRCPLAQHQRRHRRGGQRQHAGDHRGVHGIDPAQRQRQEQRKAQHRAQRTDGQRRPVPARRRRRRSIASQATLSSPATAARPAVTKAGGSCGAPASPTASRVIGSVAAKISTPSAPSSRPRVAGQRSSGWRGGRDHDASLGQHRQHSTIHFAEQRHPLYGSLPTTQIDEPALAHEAGHPAPAGQRHRRHAGRTAGAALCRAHRAAPAGTRRAAAVGARLRRRHQVSPSTVVGAYDLLQARGLVEARPQRGFFVRARRPLQARAAAAPPAAAPVDATALIRSMFQVRGGAAVTRHGHAARGLAGRRLLQRALRRAMQQHGGVRPGCATATRLAARRCAASLAQRLADLGHPGHARPGGDDRRRHARAGHRVAHAAAARRRRAGRRTRLGGGVRAPDTRWACACCRCRAASTAPTWR
jgi:hypothetical protein